MPNLPDTENSLRRSILDSARMVVVDEGYAALSMRRLARKIGYSATSIYLHFESKDELLHSLIEEGMDLLYKKLLAAVDAVGSGSAMVRRVCEAYIDFGLRNPEYYEVMFMLHPQHMERFPPEKYRRARRNLEVIDRALREAGTHADPDRPGLLEASAVWANLHGAVSLVIAQRIDSGLDRDAFVSCIVERTLRGLGLEVREEEGR